MGLSNQADRRSLAIQTGLVSFLGRGLSELVGAQIRRITLAIHGFQNINSRTRRNQTDSMPSPFHLRRWRKPCSASPAFVAAIPNQGAALVPKASPPRRGPLRAFSASRTSPCQGSYRRPRAQLGAALLNGTHHAARRHWQPVVISAIWGPRAVANMPLVGSGRTARSVVHARPAVHDFSYGLGDVSRTTSWTCIPHGAGAVPISSWQATLQTGAKNYVQGVVPAVADWIDAINDATEFVITRAADTSVGRIEYEMARAPLEQISIARGPTNYTATLSGYSTAFAENEEPDAAYDRTLTGIRSTTTGTAATRVRCAIDWLLRPGQRAYYDEGASFVVSYINYYVPATGMPTWT